MIARWAKFLSLPLCHQFYSFIHRRSYCEIRLNDTVTTATQPGSHFVCFSYLSTHASKILNLSHECIINSVVPPSTNGTLTSEKTFPSKS